MSAAFVAQLSPADSVATISDEFLCVRAFRINSEGGFGKKGVLVNNDGDLK
jgi:hypothetical protein